MNKFFAFFKIPDAFGFVFAAVTLLSAMQVQAQLGSYNPFEPPTLSGVVHNQLITLGRQFLEFHREAQMDAQQETQEIEQARKTYWQEFPNGTGFAEAETNFSRMLYEKDIFYLTIGLTAARQPDNPFEKDNPLKTAMSIGSLIPDVDGGIQYGLPAFNNWIRDMRQQLGGREGEPIVASRDQIAEAMNKCQDRYIAYIRMRDWDEFQASGLDLHKYLKPKGFVLGLMQGQFANGRAEVFSSPMPDPLEQSKQIYDRFAAVLGESALDDAANKTFAVPLDKYGQFTQPVTIPEVGQSFRQPYSYFLAMAAIHDARSYLICLYQNDPSGLSARRPTDASSFYVLDADKLETAKAKYDALVQQYGQQAVTNTAETVRKLNKNSFCAVPDSSSGEYGIHPADLIERLLKDPNTRVPDTEILRIAATNLKELKAAAGRLVTIYGTVVRMERIEKRYDDGRFFMYLGDSSGSAPQKVYFINDYGFPVGSSKNDFAGLIGHEIEFTTVPPGRFDSIAELMTPEVIGTVKVH